MRPVARIDTRVLRHEARLIDLVPQDPKPKRTGPHSWKVLCPFHAEKTPSMQVRQTERGWRYHCFGCGEDGDAIDYVMKLDRLTFKEACAKMGARPTDAPPVKLHRAPWILVCDGRGCFTTGEVETCDIPYVGLAVPDTKRAVLSTWVMTDDGRTYCWRCCWRAFARRSVSR